MKSILLVGIVAGLAAALGLAAVFSALSAQSTAQMMMGGNHVGMRENGMMAGPGQSAQIPWQWSSKVAYSASGFSNVQNVQVTGISIIGDDQVTVDLRYSGTDTTPRVVVVASTDPIGMMGGSSMMGRGGMMQGSQMPMMGQGMMYDSQYPRWNNTQWQQWHSQMAQWHGQVNSSQWQDMQAWHNQMMANPNMISHIPMAGWNGTSLSEWQSQIGSSILESGWQSGSAVRVTLVGTGSALDSGSVSVMVYPLTD